MGGVYGNAIGMALENCPADARGLMSGILQQGYSLGYVLAACVNLGIGGATDSWKTMFWVGAGFSIAVGLVRLAFPESRQFIEAKKSGVKNTSAAAFWAETRSMLRKEWRMVLYCIILMTWMNYYSHTSQGMSSHSTGSSVLHDCLHKSRFVHHLHVDPEGAVECPCDPCFHSHENRSLRGRNHHRVSEPMDWAASDDVYCFHHVLHHGAGLDPTYHGARPERIGLLHAVLCARHMGVSWDSFCRGHLLTFFKRYSDSSQRTFTTGFPFLLRGCHLPDW
jgi:hypothetical protein